MKPTLKLMLLAAIVAMVAGPSLRVSAQTPRTDAGKWVGTWEGKLDGRPAAVLRITEKDGALQGETDFYMLKRGDGGMPTSEDKMTVAMVNPHVQDKTLDFRIIRKDETQVGFTLEMTGDRTAILRRDGGGEASEVEMVPVGR